MIRTFILAWIFLSAITLCAQNTLVKEANKLFQTGKYKEALNLYNRISKVEKNGELMLYRGISNYYAEKPQAALNDLKRAHALKNRNPINYYYSAKSYYDLGKYQDAALFYKNFLRNVNPNVPEYMAVVDEIKRCEYNLLLINLEHKAFVENMGPSVNSSYDEYLPRQSRSQQNKYYFTSNRDVATGGKRNAAGFKDDLNGSYASDMFSVELVGGNWTPSFSFNALQNTVGNESLQGFSSDGLEMFYLKWLDETNGVLMTDLFTENPNQSAVPQPINTPMVPSIGDKDLFIYNDSTWFFSSKRMGGFGGYDIYYAVKENGVWSDAVNLGPDINSTYDEISPFLTKGAHILCFSSNRLEGLGGFDIFTTEYSFSSNTWGKTQNLGAPINSPKDESGFYVSGDGNQAIFASNRIGGAGGFDLYMAYLQVQMLDQLMFLENPPFVKRTKIQPTDSTYATNEVLPSPQIITPSPPDQPTTKARDYLNLPLYYTNENEVINPQSRIALNNVKDMMVIYPEMRIILTAHSNSQAQKETSLFFSIKAAEQAAAYLTNFGINPSRITIRGGGSNFPVATPPENRVSEKLNNRIDVQIKGLNPDRIRVLDEHPMVNDNLKADGYQTYLRSMTGLTYVVKVGETNQMFRHEALNSYGDAIIQKKGTDAYEYFLGHADTYAAARAIKNDLLNRQIIVAQIIPFIDGEIADEPIIRGKLSKHPDLLEYLKYEKN